MTYRELHGCDVCFREGTQRPARELRLTDGNDILYAVQICDRPECLADVAKYLEGAPFRNISRHKNRVAESRCEIPRTCSECSSEGLFTRAHCPHCNDTRDEPGTGRLHTKLGTSWPKHKHSPKTTSRQ